MKGNCEAVPDSLENIVCFSFRQSCADVTASCRIRICVEDHVCVSIGELDPVVSDLLHKAKSVVDAVDHSVEVLVGCAIHFSVLGGVVLGVDFGCHIWCMTNAILSCFQRFVNKKVHITC